MSSDGGAFAAAPPPVNGLGNFKGVMLCNRPVDDPSKTHGGEGDGLPPFKSTISATHGEAIGLNPCKKYEGRTDEVKTRGSSAALRRHVRWLKELQGQMKEERDQVDEDDKITAERKKKMAVFFKKQRDAVKQIKKEKAESLTADHVESALKCQTDKKGVTTKKPLWAMTPAEKEEFEEADAKNLIDFAEALDYEKYLGDLEFKEAVVALNDRAGKLKKEQDKFKDALSAEFDPEDDEDLSTSAGGTELDDGIDGQSLLPSEGGGSQQGRRTRGAERYDKDGRLEWDNSTSCGDDRPKVDAQTRSAAEHVLESNSQIRAVHSQASVQKMIEKAKAEQQQAANALISNMRQEELPAPVIVQSGDVENRLHKPIDPSTLPYLYRSPAV
eukprot:gnl/TRDRNA2_/TRDRNA2_61022_c0_seq1.p1 gnl/TRDRNA2_/TRDRNA2_61022_c0~~gnl/TRDRNA2_/TRDRNA2_61022_c0_seq1.p1  ORF type:complete len:386 (+),score=122.41 gnl/TRDRNA2_/TRDRNA2_61022_c0_seq1:108-1265(+)